MDETKRKSWFCDANALSVPESVKELDELFLERIRLNMTPSSPSISCWLSKLLVYGENHFFSPHVDSQSSFLQFGTLIINLPSAHKGGEIEIGRKTISFEEAMEQGWSEEKKEKEENKNRKKKNEDDDEIIPLHVKKNLNLRFAVWFSDEIHKVKRVLSGFRIVLVYHLFRANDSPNVISPSDHNLPLILSPQEQMAKDLILRFAFMPSPENGPPVRGMVILCHHRYSIASFTTPEALEGCDSSVYRLIRSCRLKVFNFS